MFDHAPCRPLMTLDRYHRYYIILSLSSHCTHGDCTGVACTIKWDDNGLIKIYNWCCIISNWKLSMMVQCGMMYWYFHFRCEFFQCDSRLSQWPISSTYTNHGLDIMYKMSSANFKVVSNGDLLLSVTPHPGGCSYLVRCAQVR